MGMNPRFYSLHDCIITIFHQETSFDSRNGRNPIIMSRQCRSYHWIPHSTRCNITLVNTGEHCMGIRPKKRKMCFREPVKKKIGRVGRDFFSP
jgi:hypothetical protein